MATYAAQQFGGPRNLTDINLETYKNQRDWLVAAFTSDGQQRVCAKENYETTLRADILAGHMNSSQPVRVCFKKSGVWKEETMTLREFAQKHSKLRSLYAPVHGHAVNGYWRGVLAGILLAMLNSILLYSRVNRMAAICLGLAVVAFLIPPIREIGVPAVFGLLTLVSNFGITLGVLGALTLNAFLFGLTGMAIGGTIAWVGEEKLERAPDAPAEAYPAVMSVLLPFAGSLLLWSAYIFIVYPWAVRTFGSPLAFWRGTVQP